MQEKELLALEVWQMGGNIKAEILTVVSHMFGIFATSLYIVNYLNTIEQNQT